MGLFNYAFLCLQITKETDTFTSSDQVNLATSKVALAIKLCLILLGRNCNIGGQRDTLRDILIRKAPGE